MDCSELLFWFNIIAISTFIVVSFPFLAYQSFTILLEDPILWFILNGLCVLLIWSLTELKILPKEL